MTESKSGG